MLNIICARYACSKIGEEQSAEDAEDGPPELLVSPQHGSFILIYCSRLTCTDLKKKKKTYELELSSVSATVTVYSRRPHGEDLRFLMESQRALGDLLRF